jgi:DNA-binding transcriptional regulator YiaG
LTLKARKPLPSAYPTELNTLGDWIRKTRLDRGLYQEDVAKILGVTENCVTKWELNRNEPEARHVPRIIELIGYCPYDVTDDLIDRVETIRRALGLTQEQMAKILYIDESSLASWVRREHKPVRQSQQILRDFLGGPHKYLGTIYNQLSDKPVVQ